MNHRVTLRHFHLVPDRTQKGVELLHRILALISEGALKIDPPLYNFLGRPILFGIWSYVHTSFGSLKCTWLARQETPAKLWSMHLRRNSHE